MERGGGPLELVAGPGLSNVPQSLPFMLHSSGVITIPKAVAMTGFLHLCTTESKAIPNCAILARKRCRWQLETPAGNPNAPEIDKPSTIMLTAILSGLSQVFVPSPKVLLPSQRCKGEEIKINLAPFDLRA